MKKIMSVFKNHRKKTIADREDEYKARWRKRKLSPDRIDPFQKGGEKDEKGNERNSYKDILTDAELEKEKADLIRKLHQKQKDEELSKQQKLMESKKSKKHKKEKSPSRREHQSSSRHREEPEWILKITKDNQVLESLHLTPDITYTLGKEHSDILLLHESCSKKHAKITFLNDRPNLMDLSSTNGTFLNGEELIPGQNYKLSDGDKIKFAHSTRIYNVEFKD